MPVHKLVRASHSPFQGLSLAPRCHLPHTRMRARCSNSPIPRYHHLHGHQLGLHGFSNKLSVNEGKSVAHLILPPLVSPTIKPELCADRHHRAVDPGPLKRTGRLSDPQTGTFPPRIILAKNESPCPLTAGQQPHKTPRCPLETSSATIILLLSCLRKTTGERKDRPAGPGFASGSGQEGPKECQQLGSLWK